MSLKLEANDHSKALTVCVIINISDNLSNKELALELFFLSRFKDRPGRTSIFSCWVNPCRRPGPKIIHLSKSERGLVAANPD
ncbi:hypothetical protein PoB_002124600 [Plakobranchus ocellatus]|uniref:Uncharacterized protein n=1 Tax=Plakobranchus ocellatus TaxID=259542 RepID=A0AAV3ZFR7_9GAST|nr:hypothetical protein PoB_002124600 [Plakobranchus ocellatus]